ncbi:double homeobox protein B [Eptesicus fuscus]|uniref:double homeobox protein B n=1 Tax=Eptesicus fuscus TaxID=29078 RepID=UPI0024040AA9|nr:double homeobox protein B [Eptesicus fuscus]
MGLTSTASGKLQKRTWQGKVIFNQSQKDILLKQFKQNPYLDRATKEQLAREIGVPEKKILTWFKNHRTKLRTLGTEPSSGKDHTQEQHQHQPWTQGKNPQIQRKGQTSITSSQSNILVQAFDRNRLPNTATRKILAEQTGLQGSRTYMWFQNQRSPYPGQSRSKPVNFLVEGPNETPDLIVQQHQINLTMLPCWSPFLSSNVFSNNQTSLPALLLSHVSSVPSVNQGPSVIMVQPMQAGQGGEKPPSTWTLTNYLPIPLTPGWGLSSAHNPFWLQNQEKCQNHKEQTATGVLQLQDYSQPHPDHRKHQSQDLDQMDISYIVQWCDERCQALIAEWDPREGTQSHTTHSSAGDPSHSLG